MSDDNNLEKYEVGIKDFHKHDSILDPFPNISARSKVAVLKLGEGDFSTGFPVTLQIGEEKTCPLVECHWFPCTTWLPVIFQNPAQIPPFWQELRDSK